MRIFSILFVFLLCILNVRADTYYVSNSGNNSHNGDQNNPWETLQYAADHTDPGDTVIVESGNYAGFYMDANGTANNPIVFKAMKGAIITTKNQTTKDAINLEGADHIVIDGFTITNTAGTIERTGIRSVVNTGVVITNNTITGMGQWGIFTGFSESIAIVNNSCSFSQEEHGIYHSNSADNPVIKGNICFSNNGCGLGYDIGAYEYTGLTGIQTFSEPGNQLLVHPNPASEYFVIKSETGLDRIEIITSDGRIEQSIHTEGENALTVPVEGLNKGLLFIRVFSEGTNYVSHLLVP